MKSLTPTQWIIIAETLLIIIMLILIFFRNIGYIKKFIQWVRPSLQGENRTASGRRIIAFIVTNFCYVLGTWAFWHYCYTRPLEHLVDPWVWIGKFCVDVLFIGLLWGFINQQTLVALKNGGGIFTKKEEVTTTTSSIVKKSNDSTVNDETADKE